MTTLQIPVKFQNGDQVYTIKQMKVEMKCDVCEGEGKIKYNDKDMRCPECMGVGKFTSNKNINVVCDDAVTVSSTKININSNGEVTVRYKIKDGYNSLNRAEENLFANSEEAQVKCDELNRERIYVNLSDIIITESFNSTQPSLEKMVRKLEYYKAYKKFDKDIVINKDNVLVDGYINYLLCKSLNINIVKAIIE